MNDPMQDCPGHHDFYVYKTNVPVELQWHIPLIHSYYVLSYKMHEFVCRYAKKAAAVRIPSLMGKDRYLGKADAQKIGKAMNTHEERNDPEFKEWILETTGISLERIHRTSVWHTKNVFLYGEGIEIQRCRHHRGQKRTQLWWYWKEAGVMSELSWES